MPEQLGGLPAAGFTRIAAFGTLKTNQSSIAVAVRCCGVFFYIVLWTHDYAYSHDSARRRKAPG